jgi:hypothetical protein
LSYVDKQYQTNWGRLCPFLISKARSTISKLIEPDIKNVIRLHTDGFITKTKYDESKIDDKLGSLKFEGSFKNVMVLNCNRIIYE